jgi:Gpi18-like mannosyltransferase
VILWVKRHEEPVLLGLVVLAALLLRKSLIYFVGNADYNCCLKPWYDYILDNGGLAALGDDFSNYPTLYLLMLVATSTIFGDSGYKPYAIKGIPILFDLVGAFFVYKIVKLKYPDGRQPVWAAAVFLFLPSIFIVSGYWGQNDMLYVAGLLACLYFVLIEKEHWSLIALGWAFAIKLQAIFLLPFVILLLLRRRISWRSLLWVPAIYLLAALPAWLAGRPLNELVLLYYQQASLFPELTLNAPSLYAWLQRFVPETFVSIGVGLALIVIGGLVLWAARRAPKLGREQLVVLAYLSVLVTPFLLPKMHERYFLAADAFAVLLAFYQPRYAFVPVVLSFVSVLAFVPFLFGAVLVPIASLAWFVLGVIVLLLWERKQWWGTEPS